MTGVQTCALPICGCCFLTDKSYSDKLVDMWKHHSSRDYELDDIMLLKVGRHIRPRDNFKMIVGREEGENKFMEGYRKQFISLFCSSHSGPLVLIDGDVSDVDLELAASIAARYGQGRSAESVEMNINFPDGSSKLITVAPISADNIADGWYV